MKVLVTGGCGFIGSNFINYLIRSPEVEEEIVVTNLDKQTYAGRGKNLEHLGLNHLQDLIKGDICNQGLVNQIFRQFKPDFIFNFAAESHVDKSIKGSKPFLDSNVGGVVSLLEAVREKNIRRFIQISTDEVYGSRAEGSFCEEDRLEPSSPYSASKAAAEHFVQVYCRTHNTPTIITRSANNYGPYQFPEKVIPLFISNLIDQKKVPLMWSEENPGLNIRDWIHVEDNCRAIWHLAQNGENGEIYNIPGENETTNIDLTRMILDYFNYGEEMIEKIPHRKAHDRRYSITGDKLKETGFKYKHKDLEPNIHTLCKWYQQNPDWWGPLKEGI